MSDFRQLGSVVRQMQKRIWQSNPRLGLQSLWQETVGHDIAANTSVRYLRDGVMVVSCSSGGWACELKLVAGEIKEKLNQLGPPEEIKDIRFIHQAMAREKG